MRSYLLLMLITMFSGMGCTAQKNILVEGVNTSGKKQPVEDDVLKKLQNENDLVIAFAYENFAWVKSMNYLIVVQHGNEWKGFKYYKNMMPNNAGTPTNLNNVPVDKNTCNSLLEYITINKAWNLPGDGENGFCADGNKTCNINDAAGNRLWIITKASVVNPGYYAAEFYEKCCPERQRGLFVAIGKKIESIVGNSEATE